MFIGMAFLPSLAFDSRLFHYEHRGAVDSSFAQVIEGLIRVIEFVARYARQDVDLGYALHGISSVFKGPCPDIVSVGIREDPLFGLQSTLRFSKCHGVHGERLRCRGDLLPYGSSAAR